MLRIEPLLRAMKELGGRHLHLSAGQQPYVEVQGIRVPLPGCEAQSDDELRRLLRELLPDAEWNLFERRHDASFTCTMDAAGAATGDGTGAGSTRLAGRLYEHLSGLGAVLRLLPERAPSLAELSAPPVLSTLCQARGGIIVVAGLAGAGKSTTLAALLDGINEQHSRHLLALEETVTVPHGNKKSIVLQRQIGGDGHLLEESLRAASRQDVDVILVDPLPLSPRLPGVVPALLHAAESGTLCLIALRAASIFLAIESLVGALDQHDQARLQLGKSLRAVVCQRLCHTADGKGEVAAHEVLLGGPALPAAIAAARPAAIQAYLAAGQPQGMLRLADSLAMLRDSGAIGEREAQRQAAPRWPAAQPALYPV